MLDKSQFREINDQKLVREYLLEIFQTRTPLEIWQQIDTVRLQATGIFSGIYDEEKLQLSLTELQPWVYDKALFVYCPAKKIVFRTSLESAAGRKIELLWPGNMMIPNFREHPRYIFREEDHHVCLFTKPQESNGESKVFKRVVFDYSPGGMAFRISKFEKDQFKEGEILGLHEIPGLSLETPVTATIHYMSRHGADEDGQSEFYRVGVKFKKSLDGKTPKF
jgi:hypothetical protein